MFGRKLSCGAIGLAVVLGMTSASALAAATRTGIVAAKITVTFAKAPPSGSSVSCALSLIGDDTLSPTDAKSTSATVSGSTAVCTFSMHYRWVVSSATSHMTIAYSVSGPSQSSSGISRIITLPANNATTQVAIAVTQ